LQVLAEMVNLHFLGLMEALLECQSTILAKLMPLWCPVLQAYNITVGADSTEVILERKAICRFHKQSPKGVV
jgi:hypothetical protein